MTTAEQYKKANAAGLKHRTTGDFWSYYTPSLQIAYNLGLDGVSIQDVEPIIAFRFGKAPENFISWNYRDNAPEKGLSVYTENSIVRGEFTDRKKYEYAGLPVAKGGDGEILILAFDAENND
jgi:hypothetical protein